MNFSDQELRSEVLGGSKAAFDQLMRRYERLVYRVAYGFTGDRESAMDVTQETFLKVHLKLAGWRGSGELRNWIARIAANEAMNHNRSRRRHPTTELDEDRLLEPDPSPEQRLETQTIRDALHRSLESLNPRQRLALVLRYFEDAPTSQISSTLGCSDGEARNILFRGLLKLRATMAHSEETPN